MCERHNPPEACKGMQMTNHCGNKNAVCKHCESDNFLQAPKILMESWTMQEVLVSGSDNNLPGVNATHIRRKVREVKERE